MARPNRIIVFGFMADSSQVQKYFRPGDAGNFNFYGYYGRIGYSDHAGKLGTLVNPGNFKS